MVCVCSEGLSVVLRRIGYWGSGAPGALPDPVSLAGAEWVETEREDVEDYLGRGFVSSASLGREQCRLCGRQNGSLELSDGTFCWPEGLRHYVQAHSLALPREFIDHVVSSIVSLMDQEVDDEWWIEWARKAP